MRTNIIYITPIISDKIIQIKEENGMKPVISAFKNIDARYSWRFYVLNIHRLQLLDIFVIPPTPAYRFLSDTVKTVLASFSLQLVYFLIKYLYSLVLRIMLITQLVFRIFIYLNYTSCYRPNRLHVSEVFPNYVVYYIMLVLFFSVWIYFF